MTHAQGLDQTAPPADGWRRARLVAVRPETPRVKTFSFAVSDWPAFRPGQYVDLGIPRPDGRTLVRSYSIASPPETSGVLDLTVAAVASGDGSGHLHESAGIGDEIAMRGPLGDSFTWSADQGGPLLLVAGGCGIVPLMAMLRHCARSAPQVEARLLYSVGQPDDVIYADELSALAASNPRLVVRYAYTRQPPPLWTGYARRVDRAMLAELLDGLSGPVNAYLCGPRGFVTAAESALAQIAPAHSRVQSACFGL